MADGPARTAAARRAAQINPFDGDYKTGVGIAYEGELRKLLAAGDQAQQVGRTRHNMPAPCTTCSPKRRRPSSTLYDSRPTSTTTTWSSLTLYNLGGETLNKQYYAAAIDIAHRGIAIEKYGPAIRVQLARALFATGKSAEAMRQLEYCLQMDPAYGAAALPLAQAYAKQGKVIEALTILKTVEGLLPGQPGVAEAIAALEASATPTP